MSEFSDLLKKKHLWVQSTPGAEEALEKPSVVYAGFDPTADSLHVGHLLVLSALARFQQAGHQAIVVIGGATGLIGDPSGKSSTRPTLSKEEVARNCGAIATQISEFFYALGIEGVRIVDNDDWYHNLSFVDFLRAAGNHAPVSEMLSRGFAKNRLANEAGFTFTEFAYPLVQAYDFLSLFDTEGCTFQIGGNDQWGNMVAGTDLIRRKRGQVAHVITVPLMLGSNGEKLGKTNDGPIWLDPKKTSPYKFHQYISKIPDSQIKQFLGQLDFRTVQTMCIPTANDLANRLTKRVHGEKALADVNRAKRLLFSGDLGAFHEKDLDEVFEIVPSLVIPSSNLDDSMSLVQLLFATGLVGSHSEGIRLIKGGGATLNKIRVDDPFKTINANDVIHSKYLLVGKGKSDYALARVAFQIL